MIVVGSDSPAATEEIGRRLGEALEVGDVLALSGDLGAGKTCLVRGLAAGIGADPAAVCSPTFVLHHVYRGSRLVLHHVDLYRLGPRADLQVLDLEALAEEGALAIEWAEFAGADRLARLRAVAIEIAVPDPRSDRRILTLAASAPARLRAALATVGGTRRGGRG